MTVQRRSIPSEPSSLKESVAALVQELSPFLSIRVSLRFGRDAAPGLFHQPALTAMLRTLMQGELAKEPLLWVEATETGRANYQRGEDYRFNILAARPAHAKLMHLIERLPRLNRLLSDDPRIPFGADLSFQGFLHPINDTALRPASPVVVFDQGHLQAERERFLQADRVRVRLLAPLRVLRDKTERGQAQGDARYVHDAVQIGPIFFRRIHDTLLAIAKPLNIWMASQQVEPQPLAMDAFHVDWEYRNSQGAEQHMAGMLGWLDFTTDHLQDGKLDVLLIAQRLGIGQRRSFGWGALRLETPNGQGVVPPRHAIRSLLCRAAADENLRQAFRDSCSSGDTPRQWRKLGSRTLPADAIYWLDEVYRPLLDGAYQPPAMQGRVLLPHNGRLRPLAVPPWEDRFLQRAVARVLAAELESLFSPTSFGYRRGRSRYQLRDQIGRLYRQGYRCFFEADIAGFFDHVEHDRVETRLRGLLGDDPVIEPVMQWLAAPVRYERRRLDRQRGLPQGSPLSPVLANMLLEDLDADCQAHDLRLLRYADDFIVLCRDEQQARAAWERAEISIGELGLRLKDGQTGIGRLDDGSGLQFLGFRFIGDLSINSTRPEIQSTDDLRIPPQSWLAELAARHPEIVEKLKAAWLRRHQGKARPGTVRSASVLDDFRPAPQPSAGKPDSEQSDPAAAVASAHHGEGSLLCVTKPALLAQRQGQLMVLTDTEGGRQYPWSELEAVLIFEVVRLTSGVVAAALDHGVVLHFLGGAEGYRGRLSPDQYAIDDLEAAIAQRDLFADRALRLLLARELVRARLYNQREVLRQRLRQHHSVHPSLGELARLCEKAASAKDSTSLNGLEGNGARIYYQTLALTLPEWAGFKARNRRPPRDPFNALLSLGYTILYSRTLGLLQAMGFHPRIAFYHKPHGRHAVLASDLMEPFRHLVERTACTVLNRGELKADDFTIVEARDCRIARPALRRYLARLAESMARPMSPLDGNSGNFYVQMQRQLRSLDLLRRGEGDFRPWFFRTK